MPANDGPVFSGTFLIDFFFIFIFCIFIKISKLALPSIMLKFE